MRFFKKTVMILFLNLLAGRNRAVLNLITRSNQAGIMFTTLERIAQIDPRHADIVFLENYAAFQNSLYDLGNVVPTLAKSYP